MIILIVRFVLSDIYPVLNKFMLIFLKSFQEITTNVKGKLIKKANVQDMISDLQDLLNVVWKLHHIAYCPESYNEIMLNG